MRYIAALPLDLSYIKQVAWVHGAFISEPDCGLYINRLPPNTLADLARVADIIALNNHQDTLAQFLADQKLEERSIGYGQSIFQLQLLFDVLDRTGLVSFHLAGPYPWRQEDLDLDWSLLPSDLAFVEPVARRFQRVQGERDIHSVCSRLSPKERAELLQTRTVLQQKNEALRAWLDDGPDEARRERIRLHVVRHLLEAVARGIGGNENTSLSFSFPISTTLPEDVKEQISLHLAGLGLGQSYSPWHFTDVLSNLEHIADRIRGTTDWKLLRDGLSLLLRAPVEHPAEAIAKVRVLFACLDVCGGVVREHIWQHMIKQVQFWNLSKGQSWPASPAPDARRRVRDICTAG